MSCGGIFICIRCKINDPCLSNSTGLHSVHKSDLLFRSRCIDTMCYSLSDIKLSAQMNCSISE